MLLLLPLLPLLAHAATNDTSVVSVQRRIFGGNEAQPGQYPFQAAIWISGPSGSNFCGGSILTASVVITAAHCAITPGNVTVVAGTINRETPDPSRQSRAGDKVVVHPNYQPAPTLSANDVALVHLATPFELNNLVKTIDLPKGSSLYDGWAAVLSGWGATSTRSSALSPILRFAGTNVVSNKDCKTYVARIVDSMICTAPKNHRLNGACVHDSGGPLSVKQNRKPVLIGVIAAGLDPICTSTKPSISMRVTSFVTWINDEIKKF